MKHILILFTAFICGCSNEYPVFKIISHSDSKPLQNHKVVLYNGDIQFKLAKGTNPYPYEAPEKQPWFLDERTTNDSGLLKLNKIYNCSSIILVPGETYQNIHISFSNNLSNTYSSDHIRIVDFVGASTSVRGNYIYDLKNKKVTYYRMDGDKTVEEFEFITIVAERM